MSPRSRRPALLTLAAVLLAAPPARAAEGFALRTFEPAPAGDRFLTVPGAEVEGHLAPAASLGLGWTTRPLVLRVDGVEVPDGALVERRLTLHLGGALALWDRVLLEASLPLVADQSGQRPLTTAAVAGASLEDPRLGARVALWRGERLSLAAGLSLWLPLGDAAGYGSDGALRAAPALLVSGRGEALVYAAEAGLLLRRSVTFVAAELGSAVTVRAAAGWLLLDDRLQVGPELRARSQLVGPATWSLEAMASARCRVAPGWSVAAALGSRVGHEAPGAAPFTALLQVGWGGEAGTAVRRGPAPVPQARPEPLLAHPAPVSPAPVPAPAPAPEPPLAAAPPARPRPEVKLTRTRVLIPERIVFDIATAAISNESLPILEAVAGLLQDHPEVALVVIEGHTDTMGRRSTNLALSRERAEAVRSFLIRLGVAPGRLQARGFGPDRPIGDNETAAGREQNRRVDFVIPGGEGR